MRDDRVQSERMFGTVNDRYNSLIALGFREDIAWAWTVGRYCGPGAQEDGDA